MAMLLWLPIASQAHAIDCAKAQEPIERAICGDPAAKAADDAMGVAFRNLLGGSSASAREVTLDDQRAWIATRNRQCPSHRLPPAECARTKAVERTRVLSGHPESGPGLAGGIQPMFLRRVSEAEQLEFEAQFFRFGDPRSAGERLVNREADAAARHFEKTLEDFLESRKDAGHSVKLSYHETWSIRHASPSFLSIWKEQDDYSGGAHPNGSASGLNIDLRNGRVLTFDDLFDRKALGPITRLCMKDIEARDGERLEDVDEASRETRIASGLTDLSRWSFTEREARIYFGIGTLGDTYIAGAYECVLTNARLDRLSKAPLPPR